MSAENLDDLLVELVADGNDTSSSEREDNFVSISANGESFLQSLDQIEKDDTITSLVNALRVELGDFTLFQLRNIALYYTGRTGNLANYSEPVLLLIGFVAVLREIQLRYKEYHESEADRFPAKVGGVVGISKLLTITSFAVADYFYLRDKPSLIPDKVAGIAFMALFAVESVMDSLMSAHYPANDYRAVAFFIMAFLKANLIAAAILQFFEKTELPGLIMAAVLFPVILLNLERFSRYYHQAKVESSSASAVMLVREEGPVGEGSHLLSSALTYTSMSTLLINEARYEENPRSVVLSESNLTFLGGARRRLANAIEYLTGNLHTAPRPPL